MFGEIGGAMGARMVVPIMVVVSFVPNLSFGKIGIAWERFGKSNNTAFKLHVGLGM